MRVLVTGADGFIGFEVVNLLEKQGHEVVAFAYKEGSRPRSSFKVPVIVGDVRSMKDLEKAGKPGCIFHLAANADPTDFGTNMMETNVIGTCNVLEFARMAGAKVVFSSSAAVYGNLPAPNRDDGEMCPANAYGYTKAVSELFCKAHAKDYGTDVVILRYFNTYGIGEEVKGKDASMIYHFTQSVLRGETIELYGDGRQSRDFVHVRDVAKANLLALEKSGLSGQAFNVGTGKSTNFNELVRIISEAAGRKVRRRYVPNPLKGYQFNTMADLGNSSAKLGFKPDYSLEKGIEETAGYYAKVYNANGGR